jgi:hypothetical protein
MSEAKPGKQVCYEADKHVQAKHHWNAPEAAC